MQDEKYIYFVLELLQGGRAVPRGCASRAASTRRTRNFSALKSCSVHMHTKKVAYRALKPENLVLDSKGYLKIVDLGLAKVKTWSGDVARARLPRARDHPERGARQGSRLLGARRSHLRACRGRAAVLRRRPDGGVREDPLVVDAVSSSFNKNLQDIVRKLLKLSQSALGNGKGGCQAITKHKWFSPLDWDGLLAYSLEPPFKINVKAPDDASNFDAYEEEADDAEPCPDWNPKI